MSHLRWRSTKNEHPWVLVDISDIGWHCWQANRGMARWNRDKGGVLVDNDERESLAEEEDGRWVVAGESPVMASGQAGRSDSEQASVGMAFVSEKWKLGFSFCLLKGRWADQTFCTLHPHNSSCTPLFIFCVVSISFVHPLDVIPTPLALYFCFGFYCLQTPLLFPDYFLHHHVYWPHSLCIFYCHFWACFIFYLLHSHFYCTHLIYFMHLLRYSCTIIFLYSTLILLN